MSYKNRKSVVVNFRMEKNWHNLMIKYLEHGNNLHNGEISDLVRYCIKMQLPIIIRERTPELIKEFPQ